jgi:adenine deaminase
MVNANRMVENGLTVEDALRAFTIWPAEILGVGDQLGSIEVGKIANLTVTRGDLFDRNNRIAHVFIDGRPVDLRPAPSTGPTSTTSRNLTGAWSVVVNLGEEKTISLNLRQEGDRLSGSIQGPLGTGEISNASAGNEIRFTVVLNIDNQTREATFVGTLTGNEIRGSVTVEGRAPGTFTATRNVPSS